MKRIDINRIVQAFASIPGSARSSPCEQLMVRAFYAPTGYILWTAENVSLSMESETS